MGKKSSNSSSSSSSSSDSKESSVLSDQGKDQDEPPTKDTLKPLAETVASSTIQTPPVIIKSPTPVSVKKKTTI